MVVLSRGKSKLNKTFGGFTMITTTIFPGRYIQGYDAIQRLRKLIPKYGNRGFLICSPSSYEKILPELRESLNETVPIVAEKFGRECSDEEITRLTGIAEAETCDIIVGIGGGKTLDTAKAVAHGMSVPVIIVPTIASTDAPCSALSVIYRPNGQIKRFLIFPKNPDIVLVDTKIIANTPVKLLVAGMGDALATWFEAESCMNKHARNMTGSYGSMTAYTLAHLCYETLIEYGLAAKLACKAGVVTPALEHVVEANTLLSGIGFESGGVAAAHAIHDGLNALQATHAYYHGEKVAFGTLASLFLTDKPHEIIDEVYSFCESVGLPTTLTDLGLEDASKEEMMKVAGIACSEKESIHNEPMPATTESVFAAIMAADAEGKRRKK
jgi:glycerol dehydrogenase